MREAAFERGGGGGGWSTPWTAGFGVCRALWRPDATRKTGRTERTGRFRRESNGRDDNESVSRETAHSSRGGVQ